MKRTESDFRLAFPPRQLLYSCLRIGYKDWGDNKTRHPTNYFFTRFLPSGTHHVFRAKHHLITHPILVVQGHQGQQDPEFVTTQSIDKKDNDQ